MRGLNVLKVILVALGGAFWVGYLWVYRPEIGEIATVAIFTVALVIATDIRKMFIGTICFLISAISLASFGYLYLESIKQLIVMLLVASPMASAMFLHVAEQESTEEW
ncbi:hypothetical protein KM903_12135 [Bacillus glycinifermentans]|uniref:hypothetical protein n=1 Tax=Bacillus glycinifermentans TaxID=1664069 RepID=UPI001582B0DD|nr:hypothetical protein [Bacillus glycinifermentans]MBU8787117.1 hypothetical protein [Bacillus glycinifermentans]NUJ16182.1 hypothetical protein [Bacillus glycinifermentans]